MTFQDITKAEIAYEEAIQTMEQAAKTLAIKYVYDNIDKDEVKLAAKHIWKRHSSLRAEHPELCDEINDLLDEYFESEEQYINRCGDWLYEDGDTDEEEVFELILDLINDENNYPKPF